MPRTSDRAGFYSAIQSSVRNMYSRIWKRIPLLMKEGIVSIKEKVQCWMGINESNQETCDTMNNSEMSEVLRNNPQNKTRYLCCLSPSLHCTLWMYSNVFFSGEAVSFRYWFFMFHFVLFRERPPFICHDPVFYGKIVLRPISYVAKMLMAKLPRINYFASSVPSCLELPKISSCLNSSRQA